MNEEREPEEILDLEYLGVYDDGTIGVSDGVRYIGAMSRENTELLYLTLKNIFEEGQAQ
jgi:hypothetical protein